MIFWRGLDKTAFSCVGGKWLSRSEELARGNFLFALAAYLRVLGEDAERLGCCLHDLVSVAWSNSWGEGILSAEWSVWGVVIPSNSKDAALRLWLAWNWRKDRWNLSFLSVWRVLQAILVKWLGLDLVPVIIE